MDALERARAQPTVDTETAAEILGISADVLWRGAQKGTGLPIPFFRAGRRLRWPSKPILALVSGGIDDMPNGIKP